MFAITTDVCGLITLLLIPILWSIYTSLSHAHSTLDNASLSEEKPRAGAEEDLDSDSDSTTITGGTYNDDAKPHLIQPHSSAQTSNLQFSEVLVIFERFN